MKKKISDFTSNLLNKFNNKYKSHLFKIYKNSEEKNKKMLHKIEYKINFLENLILESKEKIHESHINIEKHINDIHHHIHLSVKSSDSSSRFNLKKLNGKIKILFLIHNVDAWISICDVIYKALESNYFDVIVCSIPKRFPGETIFSGEENVHHFLNENNINHIRLNMTNSWSALDIIRYLNPDVLFRQSQWDDDYDIGLRSDVLSFTRLAYIGYELVNQTENVHFDDDVIDNATDSHWHRCCWRVYCANGLVKDRAIAKGRMQGRQFVVTGHPKVEYLLRAKPSWPSSVIPQKKRLVWSAHHTITNNWSSFGMFHLIWNEMLAWASKDKSIEFVFSPHPALLSILKSDNIPMRREDVEFFFSEWNNLDNTFIFYGGDYSGIMAASDVLFSDSLSMPTEYQLRNKPIVFLDRKDRIKFNNIGEIIEQGFHKCSNFEDAKNLAIKFLNGERDPLKEIQKKNMNLLFGEINCAQRILENIIISIKNEYLDINNYL